MFAMRRRERQQLPVFWKLVKASRLGDTTLTDKTRCSSWSFRAKSRPSALHGMEEPNRGQAGGTSSRVFRNELVASRAGAATQNGLTVHDELEMVIVCEYEMGKGVEAEVVAPRPRTLPPS